MSTTPAMSPCHGFSVIAGVVDTGDKFMPVTTTPVNRGCGVSMDASSHGGFKETIGGRRYRRFGLK
jgi:hypothetical protein